MLKTSKAHGFYLKQVNTIEKQDLLILDDVGLKGLDNMHGYSLMEIIGEQTIANSIWDSLVHKAFSIDIGGGINEEKN